MLEVKVNQDPCPRKFSPSLTISEIIKNILHQDFQKEGVVVGITLNGVSYSEEQFEQIYPQPAHNYQTVDITIKRSLDLAFEAISDCPDYIEEINKKILALALCYKEGQLEQAQTDFRDIIEILDLLVQLINGAFRVLKKTFTSPIEGVLLENLEVNLLNILKNLVGAKERNDQIMISDLLEYELRENLEQWKNQIIPQLLSLR